MSSLIIYIQQIVLDSNKLWPPAPKRYLSSNMRTENLGTPYSKFCCTSFAFCGLKLSALVWVSGQLSTARLTKDAENNVAMMTSFDPENIDLRSRHLHQNDFLRDPKHPPIFVYLALPRTEIPRCRICPIRTHNYQTLSRRHSKERQKSCLQYSGHFFRPGQSSGHQRSPEVKFCQFQYFFRQTGA